MPNITVTFTPEQARYAARVVSRTVNTDAEIRGKLAFDLGVDERAGSALGDHLIARRHETGFAGLYQAALNFTYDGPAFEQPGCVVQ